ncbi:tyrosine-type recombinase/integrase [Comamonas sp. C24C]
MAKIAFTAGRVSGFKCPLDKKQAFLWDSTAPGLGLRRTPAGKPAYVFQGVYQGKDLRITIGSPDAWSIPQAQAKARELQRLIDEGTDPRTPKREALAAAIAEERAQAVAVAQAVTVGEIWPLYLESGKPKRKEAWKPRYRADLEAMATPGGEPKKRGQGVTRPGPLFPLLALPLAGVTEDALQVWFEREAQAGRHQATRALMMFRGFLRWCAARPEYRSLADRDAGKAPAIMENLAPSTKRRTDALETAQVKAWWQSVEELGNRTASAYLRALLLTGARREEIAALTWANVDFQWRKLTLADKASDTRTIPLSPYLAQLLATLARQGPFVFASMGKAGRITDARASHAKALQSAGIEHLTFHGLRRSFSLLGEAAGAPAGAIAQIMGHRPSAVAEGYRPRSIDALRPYIAQIEAHILALAGVQLDTQTEPSKLRIVAKL